MNTCDTCQKPLGTKRRFCSARCKKDLAFRACGTTRARQQVAALFQKMVRAEWGAKPSGHVCAVQDGRIVTIERHCGQCVCITCGRVTAWDAGLKHMHTGHFISGRSASILFDERNVAPQCAHCNVYRHGATADFLIWMEAIHGSAAVNELQQKRHAPAGYDRTALVDMWFEFSARLKAAQLTMRTIE